MIPDDLPDGAVRLATALSIAARLEPELLRAARLRLFPGVHASAEADLWFSELVTRSAKRAVFLPEAAAMLRERLAADAELLHAVREVVAEVHANAPVVVQLEEEITFLALADEDSAERINEKLLSVLNAIALEKRAGLIEWVMRALPRMPPKVRETAAASALQLISGNGGKLPSLQVQRSVMNDPTLSALIARALPVTTIWARLVPLEDGLGLEMSRSEMDSAHEIELSETKPLLIEVTSNRQSEIVELPDEGAVVVPISREVSLRTIGGDVYRLAERAEDDLSQLGMDELLNLYEERMSAFSEGEIVKGRVLRISPPEVVVDIGHRNEGLLPISEVTSADGQVRVRPGDEIDVFIERLEEHNGYVVLSREKAARLIAWDDIEAAYKADRPVKGRVLERVKGGLSVDIGGVMAFLPGSLVDTKPVRNIEALRGHELTFKIVSFDKERNNVVLSRRAVVEVEQSAQKAETFRHLKEGELTHGTVKNITDYGLFIDVGGVDALLHITDISWGRVKHPSEYFNVGDELDVVVLKFDAASERVSVGYKQKMPDPWTGVASRYPIGSRVKGRVVSLTDYGAFLELEEGVEGLIHVSEMSWTKKIQQPSKRMSLGDEVEAVVSDVNVPNRRISLSLKALEQNPWDTIAGRYPVGSVLEGRVDRLTDFGAFVEVEPGIEGLIHISDMSWQRRIKHPSEVMKKGEIVKARVINVDGENQRLSLSIREFLPNEWDAFARAHNVGDEVIGEITRVRDFGLFVRLGEGVEGLIHISEVQPPVRGRVDEWFRAGERIRARLIKIDSTERKIGLTLRDVKLLSADERNASTESQIQVSEVEDEDLRS